MNTTTTDFTGTTAASPAASTPAPAHCARASALKTAQAALSAGQRALFLARAEFPAGSIGTNNLDLACAELYSVRERVARLLELGDS